MDPELYQTSLLQFFRAFEKSFILNNFKFHNLQTQLALLLIYYLTFLIPQNVHGFQMAHPQINSNELQ